MLDPIFDIVVVVVQYMLALCFNFSKASYTHVLLILYTFILIRPLIEFVTFAFSLYEVFGLFLERARKKLKCVDDIKREI